MDVEIRLLDKLISITYIARLLWRIPSCLRPFLIDCRTQNIGIDGNGQDTLLPTNGERLDRAHGAVLRLNITDVVRVRILCRVRGHIMFLSSEAATHLRD